MAQIMSEERSQNYGCVPNRDKVKDLTLFTIVVGLAQNLPSLATQVAMAGSMSWSFAKDIY